MSIRGAHQRTTTAIATAAHPFGGPPEAAGVGIPMGIYRRSNSEFRFDPFIEKDRGTIVSTNGIFLGAKGYGKSTAMKVMTMRLMMLSAGYGLMKVAVNDHKPEDAESEYAAMGRFLGCETYDIASRSVNPFEPALKLGDLSVFEMATLLCEHVLGGHLLGANAEALKVGIHMMLSRAEELWSPQTLLKLCFSITQNDIDAYYADMHYRMRSQVEQRLDRVVLQETERAQFMTDLRQVYERNDNVSYQEVAFAGELVASLLSTLLEGRYGKMLGGQHSMYEMLSQRAIVKDWRGVSGDGVSLMRAIDHKVQINAIERNLLDLYPNIELDDEDHRSMEDLTYARSKALQSKILRSARKLNLSGSHRLGDYRKGGAGSELWGYGRSIIEDMAFFFIGRQNNNKEDLDELQDRLGISTLDRNTLTRLPRYVFAMKLGEEEPLKYVQFLPTPLEQQLIRSNSANDAMIDRPGVVPSRFAGGGPFAQVAQETGVKLKEG